MLSAKEEIERILAQIRLVAPSATVERCSDQISVLCSAYMEIIEPLPNLAKHITPGEAKTLALLLKRRGQVCSKESIVNASSVTPDAMPKMADVHICRLRRALPPEYKIETIYGVGYRLAA